MGLFSSETKIDVFSQALSLADPDTDPIAESITTAILNGANITSTLLNTTLHHPMCNMGPMLNYARDYYTLGLAGASSQETAILDDADVANAITLDVALTYGALVDYNLVTQLSVDWAVLPFLVNQRNYNSLTNKITIPPPGMTILTEYKPASTAYSLSHIITAESVTLEDDLVTAIIRYRIDYSYRTVEWVNSVGVVHTNHTLDPVYYDESYTIPSSLRMGHTYCIAKYFVLDASLQPIEANNWWFYDIASEEHPALNPERTLENDNYFYPVVPIRYNNVDLTSVAKQSTDLYKTSAKLLDKAGMDIQVIADLINDNPNVDDVDHAYVTWGIDLQTDKQESIRYLVEFFDYLADAAIIDQNAFTNFMLNDSTIQETTYNFNNTALTAPSGTTTTAGEEYIGWDGTPYTVTTVNATKAASLTEYGLNASVTFKFITSHFINGSIGSVGTSTITKVPKTSNFIGNYGNQHNLFGRASVDDAALVLRCQVTPTAYKEVIVVGLRHTNRIYGDHTVTTDLSDVITNVNNHNFIIPIHRGVIKRLPLTVRTAVHIQAVHMIINGVNFTEVKWYQTDAFKFITTIVGAVLTVVGAIYEQPWLINIGVSLVVGTVAGVAIEILNKIVPGLGTALGVVYLVYEIYSFQWQNVGKGLITAAEYLELTACVIQLATVPIQYRLKNLNGEVEGLNSEYETKSAELEKIAAQLDTNSFLNVADTLLLDRETLGSVFPVESPFDFYNRTTRNNAGLIVLDVVENYHDALLQLPTINQSLSINA